MIGMIKLYACLVLVMFGMVRYIDASCMKYGHSCWGAHGKRSNIPAREIKPDGADTWQIFKMPDRKPYYPFDKLLKERSIPQRFRYSDSEGSIQPQQIYFPQPPSYDDALEKIIKNSVGDLADESDEFQQKVFPQMKRVNNKD